MACIQQELCARSDVRPVERTVSSIVPFIAQSKVVVVLATFESDVISFRKVDPISQVDFSAPFQVSPTILRFLRDSSRLLIPILPSEPFLFRCFPTYFAYCSFPSPFFFFFSLSSIFPALCLYSLLRGFALVVLSNSDYNSTM